MRSHLQQLNRRSWLLGGATLLSGLVVGCRSSQGSRTLQARIEGDSMAPKLWGAHRELQCRQCAERVPVTLTGFGAVAWICCRCGLLQDLLPAPLSHGDRVEVELVAHREASWNRWDLVAIDFETPSQPADGIEKDRPLSWTVKRIWGLPGESLSFEQGELVVDGNAVPKPWEIQQALKVLVDADGASHYGLDHAIVSSRVADPGLRLVERLASAPGWHAVGQIGKSLWQRTTTGWRVESFSDGNEASPAVLEYRHRRCAISGSGTLDAEGASFQEPSDEASSSIITQETPIEDFLAYDPFRPRRLYPVGGLMFEAQVQLARDATLRIEIHDGVDWVRWDWSASLGRVQVRDGEQPLGENDWKADSHGCAIGVSTFARHATCAAEGHELGSFPLSRRGMRQRENYRSNPLRISAQGRVEIESLRVWRDAFPTSVYGEPTWSVGRQLESDEFFVMGDHFAASIDSRTSGRGARRQELVGRVICRG